MQKFYHYHINGFALSLALKKRRGVVGGVWREVEDRGDGFHHVFSSIFF